jgi:hypothetical protein
MNNFDKEIPRRRTLSNQKSKDIEIVLDLVRELIAAVKDDSINDEYADQLVGKLIVRLDQMMCKIDGLDYPHLIDKLEIEPPKTKTKTKKPRSK